MNVQPAETKPKSTKHHPPAVRLACRRAYVTGECGSLAELARVHHVPALTVRDWAHKGEWGRLRARWMERQQDEDKDPPKANGAPAEGATGQDYVSGELAHVREHLAKLDELIRLETDPNKLDRLSSAYTRFREEERKLDGRPLPGSRRPGKDRAPARPEVRPL